MTREEAAQRVSHLLRRAIKLRGFTVAEFSRRTGHPERTLRRTLAGTHTMRLDKLATALAYCGFELTISMKQIKDDDDDS